MYFFASLLIEIGAIPGGAASAFWVAVKHISTFIKHVPEKEGDANKIEFSSFIELKSKLEERLGETINYDALYSHFRRIYKTEYKILIKIFSHNRRKKEISRRLSKQIEKQFV